MENISSSNIADGQNKYSNQLKLCDKVTTYLAMERHFFHNIQPEHLENQPVSWLLLSNRTLALFHEDMTLQMTFSQAPLYLSVAKVWIVSRTVFLRSYPHKWWVPGQHELPSETYRNKPIEGQEKRGVRAPHWGTYILALSCLSPYLHEKTNLCI